MWLGRSEKIRAGTPWVGPLIFSRRWAPNRNWLALPKSAGSSIFIIKIRLFSKSWHMYQENHKSVSAKLQYP